MDKITKIGVLVIAISLAVIALKLPIGPSPATADVAGMNWRDLTRDRDFRRAVSGIVDDCSVSGTGTGWVDESGWLWSFDGQIDC